jgi:hypothetical protein
LHHVVCKDKIKVDMENVKAILGLKPPINQNKSKSSLGIPNIIESSYDTTPS